MPPEIPTNTYTYKQTLHELAQRLGWSNPFYTCVQCKHGFKVEIRVKEAVFKTEYAYPRKIVAEHMAAKFAYETLMKPIKWEEVVSQLHKNEYINYENLPLEIWKIILSYLSICEIIYLGSTCNFLYQLTSSDCIQIWEEKCKRYGLSKRLQTWKMTAIRYAKSAHDLEKNYFKPLKRPRKKGKYDIDYINCKICGKKRKPCSVCNCFRYDEDDEDDEHCKDCCTWDDYDLGYESGYET